MERMGSMEKKKTSFAYKIIIFFVRLFYPRMEVVDAENLPDEPAIIVSNHAQMNGPIACELYFPRLRYTWCAAEMMHLKEVPAYAYRDFWSKKPLWCRWIYKIASYAIAPLSVIVFNNANTIGVYHDTRALSAYRETVEKLTQGASVVIFPERDEKYNNIIYNFQEGFVDLARPYCKKTGREVCFVPMYIAPKLKKMVIGKPVRYSSENHPVQERRRICDCMKQEITRLGRELPEHTVVPYPNMPKKDYPSNKIK